VPDPTAAPEPSSGPPLEAAEVQRAVDAALAALAGAGDLEALREARLAHAGDRSPLALANREVGRVEPARRAEVGARLGAARGAVRAALEARTAALEAERDARALVEEAVDVTLAAAGGPRRPAGARHPLSVLQEQVADVFTAMGWTIAEGPEVEAEWFNFDALNFGRDHPARQMQDTFFLEPPGAGLVMRTHTSPVQARALLEHGVPLYVACPGRVFRTDELDATHTPVFHQVEGIAIDEHLTMAHLRGVLDHLMTSLLGTGTRTRLRPSFFPFTEPSAEMDVWFERPDGSGSGWLEVGGCGMVNPAVLRAVGVDPERYRGFAFGWGIERILQIRDGVADMHDMVEGDVRFSRHLGGVA
jgi:phenylalanyl-tRNA synthetase alpha chain